MTMTEIIEKYPKIFQAYEGNPCGINWHGVPEGWLPIVDKLCQVIQDYCDSLDSIENPDYVENKPYDKDDRTTHRYIQTARAQIRCKQIKEKFASFRFYTDGHDQRVQGMIDMAEIMCANTCETCSTWENLGFTIGWITVRCEKCAKAASKEWLSRKEHQERFWKK